MLKQNYLNPPFLDALQQFVIVQHRPECFIPRLRNLQQFSILCILMRQVEDDMR